MEALLARLLVNARQIGVNQGVQELHDQLCVVGDLGLLGEGPREPPQAVEAKGLQIGGLVLRGGLLVVDHALDNAVDGVQEVGVLTQ